MSEQGKPFDPTPHLMRVQGNREYLPVAARVAWLAATTKRYTIDTELVSVDMDHTIARATVTIFGEGGEVIRRATDYKTEDTKGFRDHTEKAVTGSIGRALAQLGFGTLYATEMADEMSSERPADAPMERAAAPARNAQTTAAVSGWNEFWPLARSAGFKDRPAVEQAIGRSMDGLSPPQILELLRGKVMAAAPEPGPPPAQCPKGAPATNDAAGTARPVTKQQLGMLWATARTLLGDRADEIVHAVMAMDHAVGSVKDLNRQQASAVIDYLNTNDGDAILAYVSTELQQQELSLASEIGPEEAASINFLERAESGADWLALLDEAGDRDTYLAALADTATTLGELNTVIERAKKLGRHTARVIAADQRRRPVLQERVDRLTR